MTRSVGIPARVVGTPDWLHWRANRGKRLLAEGGRGGRRPADGIAADYAGRRDVTRPDHLGVEGDDDVHNHNWVEVWDGESGWSFLGAAEDDPRGPNRCVCVSGGGDACTPPSLNPSPPSHTCAPLFPR